MKSGITLCSQMLSIVIENKILPCTHRKNANYLLKKKVLSPGLQACRASSLLPKCSWYNYLVMQPREEALHTQKTRFILTWLGCHTIYHRFGSLNDTRLFFFSPSSRLEVPDEGANSLPSEDSSWLVEGCVLTRPFFCACAGQGGGVTSQFTRSGPLPEDLI